MAYIIQITIPGGMYLGPEKDICQTINADGIIKIEPTNEDNGLANSIIFMVNGEKYYCKETVEELTQLINGK